MGSSFSSCSRKKSCFPFLQKSERQSDSRSSALQERACGSCSNWVEEFARGARGELLCRSCLRRQDECALGSLTLEESRGLDLVSDLLESVSWKYWKPGKQPAKLLDWLFIGGIDDAVDVASLQEREIGAVLSLAHWWEVAARFQCDDDLPSLYASRGMEFLEVDAEDRLFFDVVERSWPAAERFLETCRAEGRRVLVACKAGHNRSAAICVCWLVLHEGLTLLDAIDHVQLMRGTVLSNHGFRLQLVRMALREQRVGDTCNAVSVSVAASMGAGASRGLGKNVTASPGPTILAQSLSEAKCAEPLGRIIAKKRLSVKYDHCSNDYGLGVQSRTAYIPKVGPSLIAGGVDMHLSQRTIKMELLACLYHRGKNVANDYEYTSSPPAVIGSGFSGDVVLCRRREKAAVRQNEETSLRCVKCFNFKHMGADKYEKLKNEAVIYLSLEHPHIARLFDVYEDDNEVSLVMQYCSGGTLADAIRHRGAFSDDDFQDVALQMLSAVNYIHRVGIVHRDIKPRNWVYEADGRTAKLIDFGFSVKARFGADDGREEDLRGCLGTLGYLAPEVVESATKSDAIYSSKCDMWSLGVVFFELLVGQPAFHREYGLCDGYTEEVVLREIQDISQSKVHELLLEVREGAVKFLQGLLTVDPTMRVSAYQALNDSYLAAVKQGLTRPLRALPMCEVLKRFRANSRSSKPTRAWLLAVARSPTYLPWDDFVALRNTFKMFDAKELNGSVDFERFFSVLQESHLGDEDERSAPLAFKDEIRGIWEALCGDQESLSYCEFLAAVLPPMEDAFEDADTLKASIQHSPNHFGLSFSKSSGELLRYRKQDITSCIGMPRPKSTCKLKFTSNDASGDFFSPPCASLESSPISTGYVGTPRPLSSNHLQHWNPSLPISTFLPMLRARHEPHVVPMFEEHATVMEVVKAMNDAHYRWVIVKYRDGRQAFFDYMDINHQLTLLNNQRRGAADRFDRDRPFSSILRNISKMSVGSIANCSGCSDFVPVPGQTPLQDVLTLMISCRGDKASTGLHRVPIVGKNNETLHVFSCFEFLRLALRFAEPIAVLKSRAAQTFDRRGTMLDISVPQEQDMLTAFDIMDANRLSISPVTARGLSGDLGGVVASNVVSVADLKYVIGLNEFDILDKTVGDFVSWRAKVAVANLDQRLRMQRLQRFNVVSVQAGDSLHTLACRLVASKLRWVFLSSAELARIVGIVSARDILAEVIDQLLGR
eukprot:TRINITY_DN23236_c0_g2_i1.p1 TRINITY_DN23236_c0_g2~~TRINITY_DN23236_c0_g2_i1.p1  ORF type:complete len:1239 (+),score=158.27 TRINITY_DN23236_c0_g2_i1:40-3717(+)